KADILTFHTPLNKSGLYKSYHLINESNLEKLPEGRILINASRGEVIDNQALLSVLEKGKSLRVVLDVWEPEPDLSIELLNKVDIATPHIAG
ncbi:NAD(P)-dependent oxidoreductase, partial [Vibrio cholerae]